MKIGNSPLPISERIGTGDAQVEKLAKPEKDQDKGLGGGGEAFRVELSEAAGKVAETGITTAAQALETATNTREMVAESNREAVTVHQGLDPKKLLDLLIASLRCNVQSP